MNTPSNNPRWRVGRSLGRTLYIQLGDAPAKRDIVIGMVDTPALAHLIVDTLNAYRIEPPDDADDPDWDTRTEDASGRYGA